MHDNPRKFKIGDTVRLKSDSKPCWLVVPGTIKYIHSIKWDWNDCTNHYVGFESDGYANWGENMFDLVKDVNDE